MEEYLTMYQATGAGLALVLASFLYSWGGRKEKWKRRFISSFILACTVNILCLLRGLWHWQFLFVYPILIGAFCLGYGSDFLGAKIIKRLIVVCAVLMSGLLMAFMLGGKAWGVLIVHGGIGAWSIWLGVRSEIEAAAEEFFICMVLNLCLMMYPFIGG